MHIYLDGKISKVSPEVIQSLTPGIVQGKGVFETMRFVNRTVPCLDEHLARFTRGIQRFGLKKSFNSSSVLKIIRILAYQNHLTKGRLRLSVWQDNHKTHAAVVLQKTGKMPKEYRLCLAEDTRPLNRFTHLKSIQYGLFRKAYLQAKGKGYDDAVFLNRHRHVVETATANIFWIRNHTLYTPAVSCGCLRGVTRDAVLASARFLNIPVKIGAYTLKHLQSAESCFITNSLIGVRPVKSLGKIRYKNSQLPVALVKQTPV